MNLLIMAIIVVIAISLGVIATYAALKMWRQENLEYLNKLSDSVLEKANIEANEHLESKITETKKQCESLLLNVQEEISKKQEVLKKCQDKVLDREREVETLQASLKRKADNLEQKRIELEEISQKKISFLESASHISVEEAKKHLFLELENEVKFNSALKLRKIVDEMNANAFKEARRIIISAMQRMASDQSIENSATYIHLEDNNQKGVIIGKDGRNIKSLEMVTGVDIIIDETPNTITISSFDPVRREIAKLSIQALLQDGRVHPSRIEEVVAKTESNMHNEIINIGQQTILDLGIYGIHDELVKLIGKMKFRTSYSQNLLSHSKEVANLCATMAAELGLDVQRAKRAGLLHDIGKVWTENPELTHAIIGMQLAEKYGEHPDVCNAIGAHHDEIEMNALISPIIQLCDAISGARPGARRDITQQYLKRLQDMENIALSHSGVRNCFAVQSGKELRVILDAEFVSDEASAEIAFNIARQIEKELQYPGQIKVTVIREKRITDIAKNAI